MYKIYNVTGFVGPHGMPGIGRVVAESEDHAREQMEEFCERHGLSLDGAVYEFELTKSAQSDINTA